MSNFDYPEPLDLKKNELKTLQLLQSRPYISKIYPKLAEDAKLNYHNFQDSKKLLLKRPTK